MALSSPAASALSELPHRRLPIVEPMPRGIEELLTQRGDTGLRDDTRAPRSQIGGSVNVKQAIGDDVGLFARAGIANGSIEPNNFTDIDRTAQIGVSINGKRWRRPGDTVDIALFVNGMSREHQRYLDAGGLGLLIGDGRLPHPGAEAAAETFYQLLAVKGINVAADY